MPTSVILLGRMAASASECLTAELGDNARITSVCDPRAADNQLGTFAAAEVIVVGPLTAEMVKRAKHLKLFHVFRGGIDGLGIEHLPRHVRVCNTFHHEVGVAEFAVMAMLMLPHQVFLHDRQLRQGNWGGSVMWGEPPKQATLVEKSVLSLGIGHIGREIAVRIRNFGSQVVAVTRNPQRQLAVADRLVGFDNWREELPRAD